MRRACLCSRRSDASIFSSVDVFHRSGTTESVEAAQIKKYNKEQIAIGLALGGTLALLYFFAPAEHGFYPQCIIRSLTGLSCPGCGGLRATHQLLHGNLAGAFSLNPLLILSLPALGFFAVRKLQGTSSQQIFPKIWIKIMIVAALVFTVVRNVEMFR